jgi:hypothetical protein
MAALSAIVLNTDSRDLLAFDEEGKPIFGEQG